MKPVLINRKWTLQLPDHRDRGAWWDHWEEERLASMRDWLGPGDLVYYVGAEQGDMPALLASWGCRLILIEPTSHVWPNMRAIWDANNLGAPVASFVGFASNQDWGDFVTTGWPPQADGDVTDIEGFAHLWERDDIPRVRLDELSLFVFLRGEGGAPDGISIDTEGSELEVLRGAENLLLTHQPLVWVSIHPDFMSDLYGQDPQEVHDYMKLMGYRGELLADVHEEHWLFRPKETS